MTDFEKVLLEQRLKYPQIIFISANAGYGLTPNTFNDWANFWNEYVSKVSSSREHRVMALLGALVVETAIDKLLSAWLPLYNSSLKDNASFTYSIKEELLKASLLIPPMFCDASSAVRKIRNEFAHNLNLTTLEDVERHKPGLIVKLKNAANHVVNGLGSVGDNEQDFEHVVSFTAGGLYSIVEQTERLRSKLPNHELLQGILSHRSSW